MFLARNIKSTKTLPNVLISSIRFKYNTSRIPWIPASVAHDPSKPQWPKTIPDEKPWVTRQLQEERKQQEKPKRQLEHPDAPLSCEEMENPYKKEKRLCVLCKYSIELDYKNVRLLSQFVSTYTGRIYDKHITGLCDLQQKLLRQELEKAYKCHLMPRIHKDVRYMKDPMLFDPARPGRPNPW